MNMQQDSAPSGNGNFVINENFFTFTEVDL